MINNKNQILDLEKYFKKLNLFIKTEAKFSFKDTKLYDKKRIDDFLCCIEASWPENYKNFIKKHGTAKLRSQTDYKNLILAIKNKFFLNSSFYLVNYANAIATLDKLKVSIKQDMEIIENN